MAPWNGPKKHVPRMTFMQSERTVHHRRRRRLFYCACRRPQTCVRFQRDTHSSANRRRSAILSPSCNSRVIEVVQPSIRRRRALAGGLIRLPTDGRLATSSKCVERRRCLVRRKLSFRLLVRRMPPRRLVLSRFTKLSLCCSPLPHHMSFDCRCCTLRVTLFANHRTRQRTRNGR